MPCVQNQSTNAFAHEIEFGSDLGMEMKRLLLTSLSLGLWDDPVTAPCNGPIGFETFAGS